jgi:hypothetical protein
MDALLKVLPDASSRIGLAGFASLDESKRPKLVLVNIPVTVPNDGSAAFPGTPNVIEGPPNPRQTFGTGDHPANMAAVEFLDATSERAKAAVAKFESTAAKLPKQDVQVHRLIAAAEASLNWNQDDSGIGPPIDAVVIESNTGIRWIRRKPSCSEIASGKTNQ